MEKAALEVRHNIVRIVGVFEFSGKWNDLLNKLRDNDYQPEIFENEDTLGFLKNYWYPEFREIYFLKKEETSAKVFRKEIRQSIDLSFRKNWETGQLEYMSLNVISAEVFLFKNQLHFFAIDVTVDEKKLASFSNLMLCTRNFDSIVRGSDFKWVNWIEQHVLCGIKITSESGSSKVKVDDYSGSKFKLYTVLDFEEKLDALSREELLYDIGCVVPIGSAGGDNSFSPSQTYCNELMENKIAVFSNYEILPLFDSFTAIGDQLLTEDPNHGKNITWSQTYFRLYLHNLLIKYNLFRYNSEMINDSVVVRNKFEFFLNNYNLTHISYNFLPNLIYQKHRITLDIDTELEKFKDRIERITQAIQEEKQSRTNLLLGIVGVLTSISSIEPIFQGIQTFHTYIGISSKLFYSVFTVVILFIGVFLLMFLFPEKTKQLKRKWRDRNN